MDFLVISPPVTTPSEPPSGAFLLAAGLAGRGHHVGLLDLSLELFHRLLAGPEARGSAAARALRYLVETSAGYDPHRHRSATGLLHAHLRAAAERTPGWSLTLMDVVPPVRLHDPEGLARALAAGPHPFSGLWEAALEPALARLRPRRVLVSVAYLSQLPAAIDLLRLLGARGVTATVGGSLPSSLAATGSGFAALARVLGPIETGDGLSLLGTARGGHMLDELAWPELVSSRPYLSSRPIIPLALSTGCFYRRCLFCPDRDLPFAPVPRRALERLLEAIPPALASRRPVLHLLDSALPPRHLRRLLPLLEGRDLGFYGFARPTRALAADGLLEAAAERGCLMLQLGVEGGSRPLLDRYRKGLDPAEAERVVSAAAAAGIRTYLYLLFGLPGETPADREATRELLARRAAEVDFLNLSVFNLPVHCELTTRAAEYGIALRPFPGDEPIRLYQPFTSAGRAPRAEVRPFLARLRADPRVRPAVQRTPRWLRAAHLALMALPGRRGP